MNYMIKILVGGQMFDKKKDNSEFEEKSTISIPQYLCFTKERVQ